MEPFIVTFACYSLVGETVALEQGQIQLIIDNFFLGAITTPNLYTCADALLPLLLLQYFVNYISAHICNTWYKSCASLSIVFMLLFLYSPETQDSCT